MLRVFNSRSFWATLILTGFSIFAVDYAISDQNGITGHSKVGCSGLGCHAASASTATQVSISTESNTLLTNTVYDFRIVVHHPTAKAAGCDISVDGGKLGLSGTSSGLRLLSKELTHSAPKSVTGDSVVWNFKWTAPATAGTYHIYAAGNAVNKNGAADAGDQWHTTNLAVTVSDPAAVVEAGGAAHPAVTVFPNPATSILRLTGVMTSGRYRVLDDRGAVRLSGEISSPNADIGVHELPAGVYWLEVTGAEGQTLTRFVKR